MTALLLFLTVVPGAAGYEWHALADFPDQFSLRHNGVQVGVYTVSDGRYWPRVGSTPEGKPVWGEAAEPPIPPPPRNFGLRGDRVGGAERYHLNGKEVTRAQAQQTLEGRTGDGVPDDAGKPRLVVIGTEADRAAVLRDLDAHPALKPWKQRCLVQAYAPDHWHVQRSGFVTTGRPTIYLLSAQGDSLLRWDDYEGGAAGLAAALDGAWTEFQRRADPNYRPDLDRDHRRRLAAPLWRLLPGVPWSVWAVLGAALLVLLWPRSKP
jgi:hypothetical protein